MSQPQSHMHWVRSAQEVEDKYGRSHPMYKEYRQKAIQAAYEYEQTPDGEGVLCMVRGMLDDGYTTPASRPQPPKNKVDYEAIRALYMKGLCDAEIGRRLEVLPATVSKWRARNKLPLQTGGRKVKGGNRR